MGRNAKGQFCRVDEQSFKMTIIALGNARVDAKIAARAAVHAAGVVLLYRTRKNASRTDHTYADLRRMDHPYARRHGSIKTAALGGDYVSRPYMVHKRSGAFLSALGGRVGPVGKNPSFDVVARPTVPWVKYVIQGTRVMLPRDIIWGTAREKETRVDMMKAVVSVLGKGLRLQAAVRFSGL